jgi:hypothetical protein
MKKTVQIFDLETYKAAFTATFLCTETQEVRQFVISEDRNELMRLLWHLNDNCLMLVGFNNIGFDYPIIHALWSVDLSLDSQSLIDFIYNKAQSIIECQNSDNFKIKYKHIVYEDNMKIPQIDLYKIYHFENPAKRSSLKDIEIALNWKKVQDLPIHHAQETLTKEEIDIILEYNLNDVRATYEFFKVSIDRLKLRKELSKTYGINLRNANDPKIGSEIFGKFIAEKKGIPLQELKKQRTFRKEIKFKDCILPYIGFKSPQFNKLLTKLNETTITETKGSLEESVIYKGFKYDFGTGGIHGCIESQIVERGDELLMSCDVTSLYPSIAIMNKFFPAHIGREFCDIYDSVFQTRATAKREGNKAVNEGLKLALNGVYGKSNDKNSFFYDPLFTMQITINGQLLLCMLAEALQDVGFKMIMINTDGLECLVPKRQIQVYDRICNEWQTLTKLNLEFTEYKKMIIRDVNNYMAIDTNNKVKCKGTFKLNHELVRDGEYHKNFSYNVIQIALSEYFINGVSFEQTIKNHHNIYDFCGRFKCTKGWHSEIRYISYDHTNNPFIKVDKLQKTNRYFLSVNGAAFLKVHEDGREQLIEANGRKVTIFNEYKEELDYKIDYDYYILECEKLRRQIEKEQLQLF